MKNPRSVAIALFALLAVPLLGLPLYHLLTSQSRPLELQGQCRQGPPGCRLTGEELEARLVVESNSLRLYSSQPLSGASIQLLYEDEEQSPPPLKLYSVGHRREWAAASAEPLSEFPGEATTLEITLILDDRLYTTRLTAEPYGN